MQHFALGISSLLARFWRAFGTAARYHGKDLLVLDNLDPFGRGRIKDQRFCLVWAARISITSRARQVRVRNARVRPARRMGKH